MAEPQLVDPHDPVMTGENSFIRLSNDGGKEIVDRVSHWRVLWSPAGQGHALFIESRLTGDSRLYSDNAGVAHFLQRTIEALLHPPFADESLPVIDARFTRGGNSLSTVEERIKSRLLRAHPANRHRKVVVHGQRDEDAAALGQVRQTPATQAMRRPTVRPHSV